MSRREDFSDVYRHAFEGKRIADGENGPAVSMEEGRLNEILVALHKRLSLDGTRKHFSLSRPELDGALDSLVREGLVQEETLRPLCMVITRDEGKALFTLSDELLEEGAELVEEKLKDIRTIADGIESLHPFAFSDISFFLLSTVALDVLQLDAMERRFLNSPRPKRKGGRYYYSVQEKTDPDKEAFGIYGNQFERFEDMVLSVYGNRRNALHFLSAGIGDLRRLFSAHFDGTLHEVKTRLLKRYMEAVQETLTLEASEVRGFEALGLMENGRFSMPLFKPGDEARLARIAGTLEDGLLALFERARPQLEMHYRRMGYDEEVSFASFFIWWYHFFYTALTDTLAERGVIDIPKSGVFSYLLKRG